VEREIGGERAAVDWWVDGVLMDEKARIAALNGRDVERELGSLLTPEQIDGLLAHRDLIVEKIQAKSTASR
jgi:hypothetical protein